MENLPSNVCPYCGKEMQFGFITNRGCQLRWIPEGEKEGFTILSNHKGIPLNRFPLVRSHKISAYYCENCHKVIIDTNFID